MIGNTNLTLQPYSNNSNNNGNSMIYVDVDSDSNTYNSSSTLSLSTENKSQLCYNTFAGLYWTGKSQDADSFTATKRVQNGTQTVNTTSIINHNQTITDTNYRLDIDRVADGGNKFSYTFGNGNTYVFNYTTDASATVTLSVNGVKQDDIPVSITISGTTTTATLTKLTASQMDQLH
jgi:hypothetical protein